MTGYFHSVTLDWEKCKGCTNCIKRCPTEAIRVREGKARIMEERCIDCGECIRICPNHAKLAVTDTWERIKSFDYRIALPAPSFYGQFRGDIHPSRLISALKMVGFDEVFEVALAAEAVTVAFRQYLESHSKPRPLISSACPAVVRLMQVRFHGLLDHIVPVESPMEIAARMAKEATVGKRDLWGKSIGVFFITPCPAKMTAVRQPVETGYSSVDGAISMAMVYGEVLKVLEKTQEDPSRIRSSAIGIGWGRAGGEAIAVGRGSVLAVDGIHNVISVLEQVESGEFSDIDFIEAQACSGGCIGGCLTVQNPFASKVRLRHWTEQYKRPRLGIEEASIIGLFNEGYFDVLSPIKPRPAMRLDEDLRKAIEKMDLLEKTLEDLPGLDCGSCGSPSCRALAEDIVQGKAFKTDCVFKLREMVQSLAEEMLVLARKVPPAMGTRTPPDNKEGQDTNSQENKDEKTIDQRENLIV